MSYPRDLDEMDERRLREELERRERSRAEGLCDYCGRLPTTVSCKFPERHRRPVDHTYDPAPDRSDTPKFGSIEAALLHLAGKMLVCPSCESDASKPNPACSSEDHRTPPIRKLDNPSEWTVECMDGAEVLTTPPGLTYEEALDAANWPEGFKPVPVTDEDGVCEGAVVLIPGMFGGLGVYRIETADEGFKARSKNTLGMLAYKVDSRQCWTCWGFVNLAGIKRVELER